MFVYTFNKSFCCSHSRRVVARCKAGLGERFSALTPRAESVYTHTHTHIYTHIQTYQYIQTQAHVSVYTHIHTYQYIHTWHYTHHVSSCTQTRGIIHDVHHAHTCHHKHVSSYIPHVIMRETDRHTERHTDIGHRHTDTQKGTEAVSVFCLCVCVCVCVYAAFYAVSVSVPVYLSVCVYDTCVYDDTYTLHGATCAYMRTRACA